MANNLRVVVFDRALGNHYSLGLARGLESRGVDVLVGGPAHNHASGVVAIYGRQGVAGHRPAKALEAALGVVRLWRILRKWRPDVLHFQWGSAHDYALARMAAALTGAPVVHTVHNPVPRGSERRWQPRMVNIAHAVIVHGPGLRDELVRRYPPVVSRAHVVPIGNHEHAIERYDRDDARRLLHLPEAGPVFAFVGQLQPRKGVETLVAAFTAHCQLGHAGHLVIAGPAYGVDIETLKRSAEPVGSRVHWMTGSGQLPAKQLDLVASAATVVVLPFHEASQSSSVIYAMTHGRCVISTTVGEVPATIGDNGILVAPANERALTDALGVVASDLDRCDRLGAQARQSALSEHDWGRVAELTAEVYASALRTRAGWEQGAAVVDSGGLLRP